MLNNFKPMTEVILMTSGDSREPANLACWPAQQKLEEDLTKALAQQGVILRRAFPVDPQRGHGFVSSQRIGMDIFREIDPEANILFATAAWQYTHHVLPGLRTHKGRILTVANWSGQWPGLVGLLNLNGSLVKAGVAFSTFWSEDFLDASARPMLQEWVETGSIRHNLSHVAQATIADLPGGQAQLGLRLAQEFLSKKAILGIFDEGCMGMYNAIIDDELLNPCGFYKERLSQSALVAAMRLVADEDAQSVRHWLDTRGMTFVTGTEESTELTDAQLHQQCKMYVAAVRLASQFGCDAIGIQYQQGLKDMVPASDLVEGLLNNPDRPPVMHASTGQELYPGAALPHFNEVDEGAAVDAVVTNRCWSELGLDPSTTLHDLRWGELYNINGRSEFVWVLQISGAAPASHFVGGYAGATSERQPPMYFPLGGGTLKGIGKPGRIVWSRVFVEGGSLHVDLGLGKVIVLPEAETTRRWSQTTSQWPLVSAVFDGISRDSFMARHRANHVNIAYVEQGRAEDALAVKAAMFLGLGIQVHLCGTISFRSE